MVNKELGRVMEMKTKKMIPLGSIVKIMSGGTPSKANPLYWGGEFPWVTAKDLKTLVVKDSIDKLSVEGFSEASKAPKNSILILVRGMTLFKDVPVCMAGKEVAFNQDIKNLVCSESILPLYLVYYLKSQKANLLELVDSAGHGTGRLDSNALMTFPVAVPEIDVQKEICNQLQIWDLAIEKMERLIAAKERNFSDLLRQLISRCCRRCKQLPAGDIFLTVSDKNNRNEELLSVTQDRGVIPRAMLEGRVMSPEGSTAGYKLIKKGDFVISLRTFQGGIEYSQYRGIISPAYTVLRPKLGIHSDFYRHFFKSYIFIEKYLNIAVIGIRDGKQISIPDFMTVEIPYPPLEQQREIAEVLNAAKSEIELLKKQVNAVKKQKQGLMQKLLTGQWRVKKA